MSISTRVLGGKPLLALDRPTALEAAESLRELFAEYRPRIVVGPLLDFSRLSSGAPAFCEVSPGSASEVSQIVQLAFEHNVPLRTRGNGHALNGSSLPQKAELVIQTGQLTDVTVDSDGTAMVGAGAILWSVDSWLRARGLALPVLNDGYAGPSVGGYVAAGGFGPGSRTAGGFWANVAELTVVDGMGRLKRVTKDEPIFPWYFGSMGQLGIVVAARLEVATAGAAPSVSPSNLPVEENVPRDRLVTSMTSDHRVPDEAGRLFWFTLFVPEEKLGVARAQLESLELGHPDAFAYRNRYTYFIPHRQIVAPLIWPYPSSCYAMGSWGILKDATAGGIGRVRAFDAFFHELTLYNDYRRYVQSEIPSGPDIYERYFGPTVYQQFRALKQLQDPRNLLNRGWVFGG